MGLQDSRETKPKKLLPTSDGQLDMFIDASYFVFYAMSNFQDLGICHQSLLLRQFVQSLQGVLDIGFPQHLIQILFCRKWIRVKSEIYITRSTHSLIVV
jgi:hypothetical protein